MDLSQWSEFRGSVQYYLEIFEYQLQKALSNDLQLHSSLTEDIGLLYNKYKKKPLNFVHAKSKNGIAAWVGDRYELWGYGLCTTWIYNNNNGSIMFELSNIYPGFFIECVPKQEQKNIVPFKQWIQDYKPYFIQEISQDVAQQWLRQVKSVLATIQANTERERMMYESNNSVDKS